MPRFRRYLLVAALAVLTIAVITTLALWEEDRRGAHAWAAAQAEIQAKGETLDWAKFVPPPVPDSENLALAPFYVRELHYQRDPSTGVYTFGPASAMPGELKDMPFPGMRPTSLQLGSWDHATHTDFSALARFYQQDSGFPHPAQPATPAAYVFEALTRYAPVLDELARAASERPHTRFPIQWQLTNVFAIRLLQDNLQQQIVNTLRLRASARLASGQSADALNDLNLAFRLCQDLTAEPTLIAHLVEITCLGIELTPIWEGLADHHWTGPEMIHLQQKLAGFDLLADYRHAMRSERAVMGVRGIDYLASRSGDLPGIIDNLSGETKARPVFDVVSWFYAVVPRGCFDFNKVIVSQSIQTYSVEAVDPNSHRVFPAKVASGERMLASVRSVPTTVIAKIMLPVYVSIGRRTAKFQTALDEAVVACALERFYLDQQAYPTALTELVPVYLSRVPNDLIDGKPMRYAQTSDGRYRLYGVGWNATDEGGKVAWRRDGNHLDDTQGDWVWQYEPFQPPPSAIQRSK